MQSDTHSHELAEYGEDDPLVAGRHPNRTVEQRMDIKHDAQDCSRRYEDPTSEERANYNNQGARIEE